MATDPRVGESPPRRGGRALARRLAIVVVTVIAVLGVAFFVAWSTVGGGVWRSGHRVATAELVAQDRLVLTVDSCNGAPEVPLLQENDQEVRVKVIASSTPLRGGNDCQDLVEVQLQDPLRDRTVIDVHTGETVSVTR